MNKLRTFLAMTLLGGLMAEAWAVDTSNWKCESCPFDKASGGTIDAGLLVLSEGSRRYGDYTGLTRSGGYLALGVTERRRGDDGHYADIAFRDLGLSSRTFDADIGVEGGPRVRFGYLGSPRSHSEGGVSPYFSAGTGTLRLPAGYPAADTSAMPLATIANTAEAGFKRVRLDGSASLDLSSQWSTKVTVRRDEREGTQRSGGAFIATAAQFLAPVSQATEQIEVSVGYAQADLQATLAWSVSHFFNDLRSVSWSNPFTPVVAGADSGRLALAPDNSFQQVVASGAYRVTPWLRATGEFALGRGRQNEPFVPITENATLAATLPALATGALDGKVETLNGSVRVVAMPLPDLRLEGSYLRDVRDNRTAVVSMPAVSADVFTGTAARTAVPYGFVQDRFRFGATQRLPAGWKASAGFDWDQRERTYQEAVTTRETTVWARAAGRAIEGVSLEARLAQAERRHQGYGVATQVQPPENPLLRKFNLADRSRTSLALRSDVSAIEALTVGVRAEWAQDDYRHSEVGLTDARQDSLGLDVGYALTDETQLYGYVHSERIRSRQAGSQGFTVGQAAADWWARTRDRFELVGLGVRSSLLKNRLEVSADVTRSRANGDVTVELAGGPGSFPSLRTAVDALKVQAAYKLGDGWSLVGSYGYEQFESQDWHLDGVTPAAAGNLLALGELAPNYRVHSVQFAVRMRF